MDKIVNHIASEDSPLTRNYNLSLGRLLLRNVGYTPIPTEEEIKKPGNQFPPSNCSKYQYDDESDIPGESHTHLCASSLARLLKRNAEYTPVPTDDEKIRITHEYIFDEGGLLIYSDGQSSLSSCTKERK
ncbi:hypothetical protein SK128_021721 [Halocaridina rubra]|uniref:Uncharacterized protein n=1 Tax=Halocaridina rubra TaxID=373956 RepID=A0AAN8X1Z7_HALRR